MTPEEVRKLANALEGDGDVSASYRLPEILCVLADVAEASPKQMDCSECSGHGITASYDPFDEEPEQCWWCFEHAHLWRVLARLEALKP
jgi:hypothetical protein